MTTLTDHLRALPDERLAAALRLRPDLLVPVPTDMSTLAVRAQSRLSVSRALDTLDRFTLEILDAIRLARQGTDRVVALPDVLSLVPGVDTARVHAAVDRLRDLLLAHGPDTALRLVGTVDEVGTRYPAGLGRPAAELDADAARLCADTAGLRRAILAAPAAARAVLDRLAAGPPVGMIAEGAAAPARTGDTGDGTARSGDTGDGTARSGDTGGGTARPDSDGPPVQWLIARHLLVPIGGGAAELPREVALLLRQRGSGGPLGPLHPDPPGAPATVRDPKAVDSAGAGQAMEAVRQVETLLDAMAADPPPLLRAGGIGVRDLRRLARTAGLAEHVTALLLEISSSAGLLAETEPDAAVPAYLPTSAFDQWRTESLASRWVRLATAWLGMTRQPGLAGRRDDRDRLLAALSPDLERTGAPVLRRFTLAALAGMRPGTAPTEPQVAAALSWMAPRRFPPVSRPVLPVPAPAGPAAAPAGTAPAPAGPAPARTEALRWTLAEAAALGMTALGALTAFGRSLVADSIEAGHRDPDEDPLGLRSTGTGEAATRVLDALLPAPVDHLLVQADLTIVVPGPPEPALSAELDLIADRESAGGASVYRITPESVRRALDAGHTAADLHQLFARRSRTPVPQALAYLIDDTGRRHGGLRVGAGAYLRAEDAALLSELLADRRLSGLGLRRIAPTVLISPYHPSRLLAALRDNGYAPTAEDAAGATVVNRSRPRRAPVRHATVARVVSTDPLAHGPGPSAARLAGIIDQIRQGDQTARRLRRAPVSVRTASATGAQAHAHALAVLQQALRDRCRVWVGYVDAHGAQVSRLVRPVSIGAGYLRAEDERAETLHTFRLERITAAVPEA